jgi:NAD(P)H-dependent FMN reductase
MRHAMPVLALLLSGSLSAQSVSDTIIQRERAKLQAEHTGEGFGALYLPTYEGVNQGGQVRALARIIHE